MAESLGVIEEGFQPDKILAGSFHRVEKPVTIKSGEGVMVRGALLGKISRELGAAGPDGGNTGDGTIGSVAMKGGSKVTTYKIVFTTATAFRLEDGDGNFLGEGVAGTLFSDDNLEFLMTVGATPWVAGDFFTVVVSAPASELYVLSLAASVDGSEDPDSICGQEIDATSGDGVTYAYETGEFWNDGLTYGTGHTKTSVKDALRAKSIFLKDKDELRP